MPTYEYRCRKGHNFEIVQSMSDDPISVCQECHAPVERVFHPVAVHFKGSGFYTTDYGRGRGSSSGDTDGSKGDSKEKAESKSDSGKSDSGKGESGKSESGKSESSKSGSGSAKKSDN